MLKDRFFYPIAAAFIALMIWFALSRGTNIKISEACILENGYEARGDDLVSLTASPGTTYEFVGATATNPAHVIMMTEISRVDAPASAGIFAALGPDYEKAFAGRAQAIAVGNAERSLPILRITHLIIYRVCLMRIPIWIISASGRAMKGSNRQWMLNLCA